MNKFRPDEGFFLILKECETELSSPETPQEIMDRCATERFKQVIDVQNGYMDEALRRLELCLDADLSDIDDVRKLCKILSNVSKAIAKDRVKVYDNILAIIERTEQHA